MSTTSQTSPLDTETPTRSSVAVVQTLHLHDGRGLCVRRWGGRGQETVVLLHGLLDSSEGWTRLCERLPGASVAFDLPGFGYSDAPSNGSIAGYARDVAEGLEMLGVDQMILVGHSLGGGVAAALAEMLPQRVAALVLFAPVGFGRVPLAEAVSLPGLSNLMVLALPALLSSRVAVTAAYLTMVTNGKWPEPGLVQRVTSRGQYLVDGVREGVRSMTKAAEPSGAPERRRARYEGPVHAVWGDRDRLVPLSHRHAVLAAFPQAHIQVWPGMAHHPMRERADGLVAVVQQAIVEGRARRRLPTVSLTSAA
ncbi:MAG TPA: alpha/beta hydrolase [Solirubrobacteraceae bacterium]|nr:alpha/beta hydrolase [Solirubrobacteraceae bacterium]